MYIAGLIRRRPVIALTLLLALAIAVLDRCRCYAPPAFPLPPSSCTVEGKVAGEPEQKELLSVFPVLLSTVDSRPRRGKVLVRCENAPALERGDRVEITGVLRLPRKARNPGEFDYARYLERQGVAALMSADEVKITGEDPLFFLSRLARTIRRDILGTFDRYLSAQEAGILAPMVIGDQSELSRETKDAFRDAGVTHVLVVSGLNVAYCSAIFLFLFRLWGVPYRRAALLTIPFIFLYALITGANPPVVRASVMALCVILALSLDREPLIYQSLSIAAAVILIFDPQTLFSPSFQLSFAATIGIVYLYPYLIEPFRRMPRPVRTFVGGTFAVSCAAQLAVLPLICYYFNRISLAGFVSNLVIVPLVGVVTLVGLLLYFVHFLSSPLAGLVAQIAQYLVHVLLLLVRFFARLPLAAVPVAAPVPALVAAYYLLLWALFPARRKVAMRWIAGGALLSSLALIVLQNARARQQLTVTFLSTGGEAIHLAFPDGRHWLIDGGGPLGYDAGKRIIVPYLMHAGVQRLDRVVITHPHYPHCNGIPAVLDVFPVGEVVIGPAVVQERDYRTLLADIRKKDTPLRICCSGTIFHEGGATVAVLSPRLPRREPDDASLVFSVTYGSSALLLTGDMGPGAEQLLLEDTTLSPGMVVELPHHGKRDLAGALKEKLRPAALIASGGQNDRCPVRLIMKRDLYRIETAGR